jgi:hypothetical protein
MNRALPAAPPVMGYTGANPVRAFQGMQGAVNRGAATLPSLTQSIQQAGANRPRLDPVTAPPMVSSLTGGGQNLVDAVRSPAASASVLTPPRFPAPVTMPSLSGASHAPGAAIGGVSGTLANGGTLAGATSPASSVVPVSQPALPSKPITSVSQNIQSTNHAPGAAIGGVSGTLANGGTLAGATSPASSVVPVSQPALPSKPITSVSQNIQSTNHQVGSAAGGVGSSLSGSSLANTSSPVSAVSNLTQTTSAAGKLGGTPAFTNGTHTATSGLFSAADPNRALKMMRGY